MQPMGLRFTGFIESWIFCCLTSRRSQPPLALAVPLSRFTSQVGGGSAFYVRRHLHVYEIHTYIIRIEFVADSLHEGHERYCYSPSGGWIVVVGFTPRQGYRE